MNNLLERIKTPRDFEELSLPELNALADEVRQSILSAVSKTGGHLAASLGVVELTVALLKVFHPPDDKILWDTGHQTYAYKMLTGRADLFDTLRQFNGLSGFPSRAESQYDAFGAGHAGTALSAALGFAAARDLRGGQEHVLAVVGDAAICCGMSLEALNNVSTSTKKLIVILNDNEMSISANVGAISKYLGNLLSSPRYNRWKRSVEDVATNWFELGWLRNVYYRIEEALKSLFLRSVLFEELGLRYIGPVDGHNLRALIDALTIARDYDRPILLHVSTQKGRGYSYAESAPSQWHGISGFDLNSGRPATQKQGRTYSRVFGDAMIRLAREDQRITAITAAMPDGTGLTDFAKIYPERFFDVGICEEHAATFAAGLAAAGLRPVYAVYSSFLQRAVDSVIHDICLQNLPVVICLDRAGIVGDDGPTHHGVFDIALLRNIPNLSLIQPSCAEELEQALNLALQSNKPVVIRYPRGDAPSVPAAAGTALEPGRAQIVESGADVAIWVLGDMLPLALELRARLAGDGINAEIIKALWIRPLDTALIREQAGRMRVIVTIENGIRTGGFGSGVEAELCGLDWNGAVLRCGWPDDSFVSQGSPAVLMKEHGLCADHIAGEIKHLYEKVRQRTA